MRALVANTDRRWSDFLSSIASDGRLDEVNFWRPQSQLAGGNDRHLKTGRR
jgi:hypothetical protein